MQSRKPRGHRRGCLARRRGTRIMAPEECRLEPPVVVGLNAVVVAVTDEVPRVLTIRRPDAASTPPSADRTDPAPAQALPFGPLDAAADRTLDLGLRRYIRRQTGLEVGYVEQLYTFADRN